MSCTNHTEPRLKHLSTDGFAEGITGHEDWGGFVSKTDEDRLFVAAITVVFAFVRHGPGEVDAQQLPVDVGNASAQCWRHPDTVIVVAVLDDRCAVAMAVFLRPDRGGRVMVPHVTTPFVGV